MFSSTSFIIELKSPEDSGFESWREFAREALLSSMPPVEIDFQDDLFTAARSLHLLPGGGERRSATLSQAKPHAPKSFLDDALIAAHHRDPDRWNLLYRLLWRLQTERNLPHLDIDPDVAQLRSLVRQVRHDLHKMHAFVRFRRIEDFQGEHFIAWHKPAHRILALAAPFFSERFAVMRWTILTPDNSVSWDPSTRHATFGPGADRDQAPRKDELEDLWRSYYSSIFNPARLNPSLMRSHMPVKYWSTLPEVDLLPALVTKAEARVESMVAIQNATPSASPFIPSERTLPVLRQALPHCRGCDLYRHATQVVPGRGPSTAALMLIGEQPGDQEDLQGKPFVGPAGEVLRRALDELGISPEAIYMTNAVKHFKFVQRGKLRLHKNPAISEINACRPWLEAEIDVLKPRVILCMGASAARAVLGSTFALMRDRGQFIPTRYSENTIATIHPSAVLRASEAGRAAQLLDFIKSDLKLAWSRATEPVQDSSEGGDGFRPMKELSIAIQAQTVRNERHT
jgi:DNA polymerase